MFVARAHAQPFMPAFTTEDSSRNGKPQRAGRRKVTLRKSVYPPKANVARPFQFLIAAKRQNCWEQVIWGMRRRHPVPHLEHHFATRCRRSAFACSAWLRSEKLWTIPATSLDLGSIQTTTPEKGRKLQDNQNSFTRPSERKCGQPWWP